MKFATVNSTHAAMHIRNLGSCQAVGKLAELPRIASRVQVTPEWLAENDAKQAEYAQQRAQWSAQHPESSTE